jgi:hypothetical protein
VALQPHVSLEAPRRSKFRVLRLQPCPGPTAHIAGADALRDYAFESQTAGMAEDGGPVAGDRLAQLDAVAHHVGLATWVHDAVSHRTLVGTTF